jgi:energy-coupling factor transporter transmembrane protein EcfT
MNIFEKRPLCLILCIGLCGFFLFSLEITVIRIILPIFAILLGFLSVISLKSKEFRILLRIAAGVIIAACVISYTYFDLYFKAYQVYEGEVEIVGVVEAVSESSSYTTRLHVNAEIINGENCNYSFYAYAKKNDAKGVIEGTKVSFKATLEGFSDDSKSYNIAKGINAYASDVTDLEIIEYTNGGIEGIFKPLWFLKSQISIFAMMISIALRSIPTLINESQRILKAQASRGVDFNEGTLKDKINQIVSLLVPMFVISYKKAEDLAYAMEARGYIPGKDRTKLEVLKYKVSDIFVYIFLLLFIGAIVYGKIIGVI